MEAGSEDLAAVPWDVEAAVTAQERGAMEVAGSMARAAVVMALVAMA